MKKQTKKRLKNKWQRRPEPSPDAEDDLSFEEIEEACLRGAPDDFARAIAQIPYPYLSDKPCDLPDSDQGKKDLTYDIMVYLTKSVFTRVIVPSDRARAYEHIQASCAKLSVPQHPVSYDEEAAYGLCIILYAVEIVEAKKDIWRLRDACVTVLKQGDTLPAFTDFAVALCKIFQAYAP